MFWFICFTEVPADNPLIHSPPRPVATTPSASTSTSTVFASVFSSSAISQPTQATGPSSFSNQISASNTGIEPTSLSLSPSLYLSSNSFFSKPEPSHIHYAPSPQPAMSATALLQKAAQIGASSSSPSLLRGLGLTMSSSSADNQQENTNSASAAAGLGLGLSSGYTDAMMDPSSLFGSKPTTLDLLGLGVGADGTSTTGLSALLTSFSGGSFNVRQSAASYGGRGSSPGETWEGATERKPNGSALP